MIVYYRGLCPPFIVHCDWRCAAELDPVFSAAPGTRIVAYPPVYAFDDPDIPAAERRCPQCWMVSEVPA